MRLLIVSHNALSRNSNMGKTLLSYLSGFEPSQVAQFYLRPEVPDDTSRCANFYRFTDLDAVKSILFRFRGGSIFTAGDLRSRESDAGRSLVESVYTPGGKRSPRTMVLRELVWLFSGWNCRKLRTWLREFGPDVILCAPGDYAFTYRIARKMAAMLDKPLVMLCVDDFFLHNRSARSALGRIHHRAFMGEVRSAMAQTNLILTICDKMGQEYQTLFQVPCRTLHTAAPELDIPLNPEARQLSYLGNVRLGRHRQLMDLGLALRNLKLPGGPDVIDVYSAEKSPAIVQALRDAPGIRFHGPVSADRVPEIMAQSMAVIHTESFDEAMQDIVRYSVSTKIAESLMYGPCLIAYGPQEVASVAYLQQHDAAFVIGSREEPEEKLRQILTDPALRQRILKNARALAQRNHRQETVSGSVRDSLSRHLSIT